MVFACLHLVHPHGKQCTPMNASNSFFAIRRGPSSWVALVIISMSLWGCTNSQLPGIHANIAVNSDVALSLSSVALTGNSCSGSFLVKDLPHTTSAAQFNVRGFESNGSGIAVGDLDLDGDLDLVLGGFAQSSSVLWNIGNLEFLAQPLGNGLVREVQVVDLNADGWLDIVTSRRGAGLSAWLNDAQVPNADRFVPTILQGVSQPLYAIDWADADGDGDLDLGGATYDAELLDLFGSEFMMGSSAGAYIFLRQPQSYQSVQLAPEAQGLAALFFDVGGNRLPELLIGNDFAVPDMTFAWNAPNWTLLEPFDNTTHSTMSLAAGDINNDGYPELMATDMKPPSQDPEVLAAWGPAMANMMADTMEEHDHTQLMENTLQLASADGLFNNRGREMAVDATGWSWSGKFGDLDNDGWLDLYIVNGMMEEQLFQHLPEQELVEGNKVFRNFSGVQSFSPVFQEMPDWNLAGRRSGRGMVMADLDLDGDLDIVVNNMRGTAQLFANELCVANVQFIEIDLKWPNSSNPYAIGAIVEILANPGTIQRRVHVAGGYLSGDAPRLHFGLGTTPGPVELTITWPDGLISRLQGVSVDSLISVTRRE